MRQLASCLFGFGGNSAAWGLGKRNYLREVMFAAYSNFIGWRDIPVVRGAM
jgi:hypothetical protein